MALDKDDVSILLLVGGFIIFMGLLTREKTPEPNIFREALQ